MTAVVFHDGRTPYYTAEDYRQMHGGKGTMPDNLGEAWIQFCEKSRPYRERYAVSGCCGHPGGPEWIESVDYRLLPDGSTEPTGTGAGHWSCRFAGPKGCCMNRVDEFVRAFTDWLDQGAPLHKESDNGE